MEDKTVNDYKPLLSTAPPDSILNAQAFRYTNSVETDIRKTFERIRRGRAKANKRPCASPSRISSIRDAA